MKEILAIMLGGGLGATSRHGVDIVAQPLAFGNFPLGTITVNIRGFLTAFSIFARHKAELLKTGAVNTVIAYAITGNIPEVLLVFAGYPFANHLIQNRG